jgi:hypothetical protein
MNALSLDAAYGDGAMNDIQDEPQDAAPPRPPPPQARPPPPQARPPPPQYQPQLHPQLQTDPHRRKVRFMNDSKQRFARSDGAAVASSSWMERNKTLVMVMTVAIILMLVVVIVLVSRKSKQPVLSGGAVPAYVGGPGYDSVSQFASYY